MSVDPLPADSRPWRVLIADDDAMSRRFMAEILSSQADLEVVAQAPDGAAAVEAARRHRPDVVLMDVQMPHVAGPAATETMLAQVQTNVVAITSYATDDIVDQMLVAGAMGFLLKDQPPHELIDGVRTVARGDGFVSPAATARLIRRYVSGRGEAHRQEARERFEALSERERDIAVLVASGASNQQIGAELHLSVATVKTHLEQARLKLGAANRALVCVLVERAGFGPVGFG
ncbi:response regulator transcription factor [Gryllotalpicola daejeonensis]|uniref:Response regulator transcription factor n=1 Tax=Gryllotalpicola daejeonensis TaxID=993087 RepID=A0ABP7ZMG1_9MICO